MAPTAQRLFKKPVQMTVGVLLGTELPGGIKASPKRKRLLEEALHGRPMPWPGERVWVRSWEATGPLGLVEAVCTGLRFVRSTDWQTKELMYPEDEDEGQWFLLAQIARSGKETAVMLCFAGMWQRTPPGIPIPVKVSMNC